MLSIITPVFNGERFIESCIKNVVDQNCSDVEHIIVDGGSTDATISIIEHYAEKYSHISWISETDNGQSDAMNKGVNQAKAEILGFLNVDDYYEPDTLNRVESMFQTLLEPSLLVGNCKVWNDNDELVLVNKPDRLNPSELLLGYNAHPYPINPVAYFYHKALHDKIGAYDIDQHYAMDIDFLLRAVKVAHLKYIDEDLGNFRQLEGTKTASGMKNNKVSDSVDHLMRLHRKDLPFSQRLLVSIGYEYYKSVYPRLKYYTAFPSALPKSIIARFTEMIRLEA